MQSSKMATLLKQRECLVQIHNSMIATSSQLMELATTQTHNYSMVASKDSNHIVLSQELKILCNDWAHVVLARYPVHIRRCPPLSTCTSAADAFASGSQGGIGGWVSLDGSMGIDKFVWGSLFFDRAELKYHIAIPDDLQTIITGLEMLAQIALILLRHRVAPHVDHGVIVRQLTDNTGVLFAGNRLYTSNPPLAPFVRLLASWSALCGQTPTLAHVPGSHNNVADALSSGMFQDLGLSVARRVDIQLDELLFFPYAMPASSNIRFLASIFKGLGVA